MLTTDNLRLYDNTRLSAYDSCARSFFFRHRLHFEAAGVFGRRKMLWGICWHEAMDVVWTRLNNAESITPALEKEIRMEGTAAWMEKWEEEGMPNTIEMDDDERKKWYPHTHDTVLETLPNYMDRMREYIRRVELVSVEEPFAVPLDPNDPTLYYVGRRDKIYWDQGKLWVGEHKSTGMIGAGGKGFQTRWVDGFSVSPQLDGYQYATIMQYLRDEEDPLRKFGGIMVDAAGVHKSYHDVFKRLPFKRSMGHLDMWLWETHRKIKSLEAEAVAAQEVTVDSPFMDAFPRSPGSCDKYSGCPYLDLCALSPNPKRLIKEEVPPGFTTRKWSPFQAIDLEKLGIEKEEIVGEVSDF